MSEEASGFAAIAQEVGLGDTVVASFEKRGLLGEDGNLNQGALAKSYVELEGRMADPFKGFDAEKPGEWDGWGKLGAKETPADYLPDFKPPEGMDLDEGMLGALREAAAATKAPAHVVSGLTEALIGQVASGLEAQEKAQSEAAAALDAQMGKMFGDDKDARVASAQSAYKAIMGDLKDALGENSDAVTRALNDQLGDAGMIMVFDRMAKLMSDDDLKGAKDESGGGAAQDAQAKIDAKRADADFMKAFRDKTHAGHEKAVSDMEALYKEKNAKGA